MEIALEQTIAAQPTSTSTIAPTEKPTLTPAPTSTKIPIISPTPAATDEVKSFTVETLDDGYSHYSYKDAGFSVSLPHN
ncbi:MAG: hypothetical protein U9N80_12560 [Chloroflexota bacterium]|nr:hypothetical protein [Chloroflexota bacterium]